MVASIKEIIMLKRSLTSGLVAIFVATGALAGTVQSSSAHSHHHHHHKHHDKPSWWWNHQHKHHHHKHHRHHGKVIIFL